MNDWEDNSVLQALKSEFQNLSVQASSFFETVCNDFSDVAAIPRELREDARSLAHQLKLSATQITELAISTSRLNDAEPTSLRTTVKGMASALNFKRYVYQHAYDSWDQDVYLGRMEAKDWEEEISCLDARELFNENCGKLGALIDELEILLKKSARKPEPKPNESKDGARKTHPDIVKRRHIVAQHPHSNASDICILFDENNIPLPKTYYPLDSWTKAYKSELHRHAIDSLISKDRGQTKAE